MKLLKLERMMGVEPTLPAWEAEVLPMNYIRVYEDYSTRRQRFQQENCRRVKQMNDALSDHSYGTGDVSGSGVGSGRRMNMRFISTSPSMPGTVPFWSYCQMFPA